MDGLRLAAAVGGDRAYVERLRAVALRPQVEAIGPWDPAAQAGRFARDWDRGGTRIIFAGPARAGCVASVAEDSRILLSSFYVEPALQGRGIGTAVLAMLLAEADVAGLPVTLTTLAGSRAANLYRRVGFTHDGSGRWEDAWARPVHGKST